MTKKRKVLLVDDESEIVELLKEAIEEDLSVEILTAPHGGEAIQLLKQNDIELIISDYTMPFVNGGELYQYNIKNKNLPFILITADLVPERNPEFTGFKRTSEFNLFLTKPIDYEFLIEHLRKILVHTGAKV